MVNLAAKVAFLARPDAYPEGTAAVEVKETHMSWVFLTARHAYKLKKPRRTSFLDYGTIEARRLNCRREVRLNHRLAPDIYLGIVPLRYSARHGLRLGDSGRVIDWLVKMRRLSSERTLEHRISAGTVRETDIRGLGHRLVAFFRSAPVTPIGPDAYLRTLAAAVRDNRTELSRPVFALPGGTVDRLAASQLSFLERHGDLLQSRARTRHIREGHGDLRPEHVYCDGTPVVMDCLEFNRSLRMLDPVDELAYLAMECERLGAPRVGNWLFEIYAGETGDHPPEFLVGFYKCFRAFLRAKIAIWHLADDSVRQPDRWRGRALTYLRCATASTLNLDGIVHRRQRRVSS